MEGPSSLDVIGGIVCQWFPLRKRAIRACRFPSGLSSRRIASVEAALQRECRLGREQIRTRHLEDRHGVNRCLAIVSQSTPGRSEAEVGRGQEEVFSCCGHVLIEPLVSFLLAEWDDHRVGVDAESCVGVRAADGGDSCLIGDDEELPWLGVVRRRHWHRGFQDRDKHLTRDRLAGELAKRPTLRDEARCFLPHAISPSHW